MDTATLVASFLSEGSPPPKKRKLSEEPEESEGSDVEEEGTHGVGNCTCKDERPLSPWHCPPAPEGYAYCNAKVLFHKDFDIREWAHKHFKEDFPILVVKHIKGKKGKIHWHVHGVLDTPRQTKNKPWYKDAHPLRLEGKKPFSAKWFDETPTHGFTYCVKPAECIGRCPVVHLHRLTESDMYQIMQQSAQAVLSFEEDLEKLAEKAVNVAEPPIVNHRRLHVLTTKYYHSKDRKLHGGIAWKVRDWIAKWHPDGHEYIADKYM